MRTSSLALLLSLALVAGCGGAHDTHDHDAGDAHAAGDSDVQGEPGEHDEHGAGGEHAEAPDSTRAAGPVAGAAVPSAEQAAPPPPLTGEAALAALRANVTATAARAEHLDELVEVTHILVAFEGAERSRVQGRTREQAEQRAAELFARVQVGEDFEAVRAPTSDDPGPPTYTMSLGRSANAYPRGQMAKAFGDVGWRLAVGEIGVAAHDAQASPFGWHIIKRVK